MDRPEEFRRWMCRRLVQTALSDLWRECSNRAPRYKIATVERERKDAARWLCSRNGRLAARLAEFSDAEVDLWVRNYFPS